jgi:hypothetical protein
VNAIEDSIETNEEVGSREKPDMMFDKYGWWVKLVGKRINDGFEDKSRGKKHCVHSSLSYWNERVGKNGGIMKSFDFSLNS